MTHIPRQTRVSLLPTTLRQDELHDEYAQVVRIAPNECMIQPYNCGTAWNDVYGFKSKESPSANLPKDPHFYIGAIAPNGGKSLGASVDQDHARIRSGMLAAQINKLISKLHETGGKPTNAVRWMHHIIYGIIAFLAFGHAVNALDCDDWDPQARLVFDSIREGFHNILKILMWRFGTARTQNFNMSVERAEELMSRMDVERPDFMSYILLANETERELTPREITANCALLLDAGSETTATMLSGCLFYLLKNTNCMQKLTELLRSLYKQEIDMNSKVRTRFCLICKQFSKNLCAFCGRFVPPGITVGVNQYSACRSGDNFTDPSSFNPERWLGATRFANDKRTAFQPFSTGPRNCLGKNLAYAELRLIVPRTLWNFDLELMPDSQNWHAVQKCWSLWQKPDLNIKFKLRKR
ncbi:benzoate 4-monooxygenase cytochrome P450 [Hyaloscypha finlandica]|nr:benzoate 4-monooxygenase cytochrome P450 [Hyaloscypha finlandica]